MKREIEMVMAVFFIAISLLASVWGVSVVSAKKDGKPPESSDRPGAWRQ